MPQMTWHDAIIKVLGEAEVSMHYTDIARVIVKDGLRNSVGKTPAASVSACLSKSPLAQSVVRVKRGTYILASRENNQGGEQSQEFFAVMEDYNPETRLLTMDSVLIDEVNFSNSSGLERRIRTEFRRYWQYLFSQTLIPASNPEREHWEYLENPFDRFETQILEVSVFSNQEVSVRVGVEERDWLRVRVDASNTLVSAEPVELQMSRQLDRAFGTALWKHAPIARINQALAKVPNLNRALFLDVGQGSSVALFGEQARSPAVYFDVGVDSRTSNSAMPTFSNFCTCSKPLVILSHWDQDHWLGVRKTQDLRELTWIVPRQKIGPVATREAAEIARHGSLLVVKRSSRPRATTSLGQTVNLLHGNKTRKTTNDSGLILQVHNSIEDAYWFFPGDAGYDALPSRPPNVRVLQATHHGGKFGSKKAAAPIPEPHAYTRLVYSFGDPNSYGHPRQDARELHSVAGWKERPNISTPPHGPNVRSTVTTSQTKRTSVLTGWKLPNSGLVHMRNAYGIRVST